MMIIFTNAPYFLRPFRIIAVRSATVYGFLWLDSVSRIAIMACFLFFSTVSMSALCPLWNGCHRPTNKLATRISRPNRPRFGLVILRIDVAAQNFARGFGFFFKLSPHVVEAVEFLCAPAVACCDLLNVREVVLKMRFL